MRLGPLPGYEPTVPADEGLRPDQERAPGLPPKNPARRGEERLVGCAVDWALHLPAQDGDLVSQHDVLEFRLSRSALVRPEQSEDAAKKEVEEGPDHGAAFVPIGSTDRDLLALRE